MLYVLHVYDVYYSVCPLLFRYFHIEYYVYADRFDFTSLQIKFDIRNIDFAYDFDGKNKGELVLLENENTLFFHSLSRMNRVMEGVQNSS